MNINPFQVTDPQVADPMPHPGITPVPDSFRGHNFPYRGGETHGVDPNNTIEPLAEEYEGGVVGYQEPEAPPDPVPVRIVESGGSERKEWRTFQMVADGAPHGIVSRQTNRTAVKVKNLSTDKRIWVSSHPGVSSIDGYPVDPGGEFSIDGDGPIYAVTADPAAQAQLAILVEYNVSV